jgi:hypothetical protein
VPVRSARRFGPAVVAGFGRGGARRPAWRLLPAPPLLLRCRGDVRGVFSPVPTRHPRVNGR